MRNILVTGGLGFIGSHTCINLLENNNLFIIDSLANSSTKVLKNLYLMKSRLKNQNKSVLKFFSGDIRDKFLLNKIFTYANSCNLSIDLVIHFAGLKSVADSEKYPNYYWNVNFKGTKTLIEVMEIHNCFSIVFSSSATIYGNNNDLILSEESKINPVNVYGKTKFSVEKFLKKKYVENPIRWNIINLRYFNPIGAYHSGLFGETILNKPTNLFPLICMVASKEIPYLEIFGNNWDTYDGTTIRDYVHIMDIAKGHLYAMQYLSNTKSGITSVNLGTGKGTSVFELIKVFEKVNKIKINFKISNRREGDVARYVASNSLAKKILGWEAKLSIEEMCKDGWLWYVSKKNESSNRILI